ncbi:GNAT family protein [uncultured Bacteroides sp.]|uniref:GNAT family N-acetyltransferase n=1 Tax=uncultured Bacteroides sp. TaxID=162156 RepID=UPI002AA67E98|nr:GNAT family protein [uncultured Bacteroides sp.]
MLSDPEENKEYVFVIHYDGAFARLIGFKDTDKLNKKTEIGYWLSESYQKKGIITESVKVLLHFAFDELDINRIQIKCAVGNAPSRNIPRKLGFKFEGVERDGELLVDNQFTNIEVYSLIKKDLCC